ncbi:ABC transporter type 1, transmembrane domain-containing protein [Chytridium lagenaria]|nr:ABC transporter type 1, transmembrane domain-containing protein [Chytridium lagenaria]
MTSHKQSESALEKDTLPTSIVIDTLHDVKPSKLDLSKNEAGDRGVMAAGRNLWTFLTLSYLNRMMKLSVKRPLEADDIPLLKPQDRAEALVKSLKPFNEKVEEYLEVKKLLALKDGSAADPTNPTKKTQGPKIPSLMPVVFRSYGHYFYGAIFFQIISAAASIYTPLVLQALILFLQNAPPSQLMVPQFLLTFGRTGSGIALSLFLFFISIVTVVAELTQLQLIRNFQFDAVGMAKVALFEKFLKIGNKAEKEFSESLHPPPQIALTIYFLVRLIGASIIPAGAVIIGCLIVMIPLVAQIDKIQKAYMTGEDGRVKRLREMLMGMKIIKLRAEEDLRSEAVNEKREEQISALRKSLIVMSSLITLVVVPPILMPIASFLLYARNNGGLIDPAIIFPALIYFGNLLEPLQGLPQMINTTITGLVALNRIKSFLVANEREPTVELAATADAENAIVIENGTFKWEETPVEEKKEETKPKGKKGKKGKKADNDAETTKVEAEVNEDAEEKNDGSDADEKKKPKSDEPLFKDLNLKIKKGKLTAVVGVVGVCGLSEGGYGGTTRVLVTHQMHVLDKCDWVVVMDAGRVVEEGTYEELMGRKDEEGLRKMMKDYLNSTDSTESSEDSLTSSVEAPAKSLPKTAEKSDAPATKDDDSLIAEEDRERGGLKWSIVKDYWNRAGGAPMIAIVGVSVSLLALSNAIKDLWLAWWSDGTFGLSTGAFFTGFAILGVVNVVMMMSVGYALIYAGFVAGKKLHQEALDGLMRAPMSFYDSQPVGRILNRMSKDIEGIDKMLWMMYLNFFYGLCFLISNIITLAYATPYVLVLVAALMVAYYFILICTGVLHCLDGVASLRAFKAEQRMSSTLHSLLDRSNGPNMAQLTIRIWLNIRVQFISSVLILFVSLFGVLTTSFAASLLGLAISTATSLTGQLSYLSCSPRCWKLKWLPLNVFEAPRELKSDPSTDSWPTGGAITVKNLSVKYASSAEPVLKDLSLDIAPGEKIGIVGRTGSGKSTFLTALFRIVEPHAGSISIDGMEITTLGLKTLRQRLQIIPQEPVLFTGTVRTNIDPSLVHTDAEIWDALTMVGTPAELLRKDDGHFKRLVDATGAKNAQSIKAVAEEHEESVKGQVV